MGAVTAAAALLLLLAQVGAEPAVPAPPAEAKPSDPDDAMARFDLADLPDRPSTVEDGTIVVRADAGQYRVGSVFDPRFEDDGKAEFGIGNGARVAAETEAATIAPGVVSNRIMFRVKMPF